MRSASGVGVELRKAGLASRVVVDGLGGDGMSVLVADLLLFVLRAGARPLQCRGESAATYGYDQLPSPSSRRRSFPMSPAPPTDGFIGGPPSP